MKLITLLSPYALALILTLIIEGVLCFLLLKSKAWLRFVSLVNLFTNPLLNLVYTLVCRALAEAELSEFVPWILLLMELVVWLSEAYLFYRFSKPVSSIYKALLFSFVLNAASYGTGLLLQL